MVAQIDKNYTKYSFGKTVQRLASYALFEGRPHTTKGQWFNPVVFSLLKTMRALPGVPTVSKPVFITGLGRSGTTILGIVLSLHKELSYLNEPKAIWTLIDKRTDVLGDYVPDGGLFRLTAADVTDTAIKYANRMFSRYLSFVRGTRLLDKYPELIFRIGFLLGIFPDAKIIFITRNGNDACASIAHWSTRKGTDKQGDTEDWWGRGDLKWRYICDQFLTTKEASELEGLDLDQLDQTNRAALEWILTMQEGIKQEKAYPGKIHRIRYEDLTDNPDEELGKLFEYCKLSNDETVVNYANEILYSLDPKGSPELLKPIKTLFDKTMKDLDY